MQVTVIDDNRGKHQSFEATIEIGYTKFMGLGKDEREARMNLVIEIRNFLNEIEEAFKVILSE